MAEARWKRQEREVARLLAGERQPNTGRRGADVLTARWAIEVKVRRELPHWLLGALAQAEEAAKATGRLPLLVLVHAPGRGRKARRYALLPLWALKGLASAKEMSGALEGGPRAGWRERGDGGG